MSKFTDLLKSLPDFTPTKGASEKAISKAERELGVEFSDEWREYLSEFGQADVNGHELTGITKTDRLNIVKVTKEERKTNPKISDTYYVIENTGMDGVIIWQDTDGTIYRSKPNGKVQKSKLTLLGFLKHS
jgi:hypothetical protein